MQPRAYDFAILAVGVAAVSTAAVIIRETEAPAMVIAAYRITFASIPLLAIAAVKRRVPLDRGRLVQLGLLAGVFIALHFSFWIASVKDTSIVTSVTLVASQPLWVAIASGPVLKEPIPRAIWIGVAIGVVGALVMVSEDFGAGGDTLTGDLFALLGAIFAAGYILVGRIARTEGAPLREYISVSYPSGAVILVLLALVSGESFTGYSTETYGLLLLLALGPQLIGHTALNRSLGHLPAVTVAIAILGEPIGASILATTLLGEPPSVVEAVGGVILLIGVYLGVRASVARPEAVAVDTDG
ncbi:MAG: DMT family transporter [Dehalococcoidia bacterium]